MDAKHFKNTPVAEVFAVPGLVDYAEGQVVSRTLVQTPNVTVTAFAFAAGEGLSAHTTPGDAVVQVLDGEASVTIADVEHAVPAGSSILMPAGVPHAVEAKDRFKMLLTLVKG